MTDLFTVDTPADPEIARRTVAHQAIPNFYESVARAKLNAPAEWRWHGLKVVGPDTLVTGATPLGFKKNGDPKWPPRSADLQAVVTVAEHDAARKAWSDETGLCWNCGGCGQESAGWSSVTGPRYRPCRRCVAVAS